MARWGEPHVVCDLQHDNRVDCVAVVDKGADTGQAAAFSLHAVPGTLACYCGCSISACSLGRCAPQAIHARSLYPCQDTPAVKFTYKATVKTVDVCIGYSSATAIPGPARVM